jgi:hypothetical protein
MTEHIEKWKLINGTNEMYKVSDDGRVFSLFSNKIRKQRFHKNYLTVEIRINGKNKRMAVHRLVALHFIPNPLNKPETNHLNGIKTDNRVSNLEWCTGEENRIHAMNMGLIPKGIQCIRSVFTNEDIDNIRTLAFYGILKTDIAKTFKTNSSNIYNIVSNNIWRHLLPIKK